MTTSGRSVARELMEDCRDPRLGAPSRVPSTGECGSGGWDGAGSSGAGPLSNLGPERTGGYIGTAYFAYGSAPGRQSVTISFDDRLHDVPVSRHGVWAFIKIRTNPHGHEFPSLTA